MDHIDDPFRKAVPPTVSDEVANQGSVDTADQKVDRRATVESEHNGRRHAREMQHIADRNALESQYHADLQQIRKEKEAALNQVGLNHDGSDPQLRPQSLAELI